MITIANPIYDVVFKYLMEDERIARTILSALLKENIVSVEARPHEYSNGQKELMSIFRIDFAATILKPDGEKKLVLIELQKTWLPTETLRFRQYLGIHYQNPKNIDVTRPDHPAIPMVAVYLLGHTVGDIEDPVVYVRNQAFNYEDEPIIKGMPNKFVDSLNHNSIFVQIPRLHGKVNNHLDKVLSIFDQHNVDKDNQHFLNVEDKVFDTADADMQPIFHRLMMAASNVEMRQDMNVEDEYFSLIKEQEGKLYGLEKDIAETKNQLTETKSQLTETKSQLTETKGQLAEKEGQLAETKGQLAETKGQLAEKEGQLAEKEGQLAEKEGQLAEKEGQLAEKEGQLAEKEGQLAVLLRTSVLSLHKAGVSADVIASTLQQDISIIRTILAE